MKTLITAVSAALVLAFATGANAAEEKKPTAQQQKMKSCNKDAGDKKLKGDERKAFMSECLKGDAAATAKPAAAAAPAKADSGCAAKAVSKDGKKLGGAAKDAFIKKCEADATAGAK